MPAADHSTKVRRLIETEGGRFSVELGLDVDHAATDVDRWFLACTLFAAPIRASVAMRTWGALADAGIRTIADAGARSWDDLVTLLDAGGYARYDYRTATRLHQIADVVAEQHRGTITSLAAEPEPVVVSAALEALPGWGPRTVAVFLRELRGVWPGADPPLDQRAAAAARRIRLPLGRSRDGKWARLAEHAERAGVDPRDLEAALVRHALSHGL